VADRKCIDGKLKQSRMDLHKTKIYSALTDLEFFMSFPTFVNGASMKTWKRIEKKMDEDTTAKNMFACKQEMIFKSRSLSKSENTHNKRRIEVNYFAATQQDSTKNDWMNQIETISQPAEQLPELVIDELRR
jgi:hypothetical protein